MALNHDGWDEIFHALPILDRVDEIGHFDITADQIKVISGREPRLMAKIDFREHLPRIMEREGLALLAITNGTYRIAKFDPFIEIESASQVTPVSISFPSNIITLNPQRLAHESAALDAAAVSGILAQVFGEDAPLTIRGRSRSPDFNFFLDGIEFPVSGVQIEVDGGYEGPTSVNLIEAKIGSRNNLNVRQLIYPQLAWEQTIGQRKAVRTYICFYQEPVLRFIPIVYEGGQCIADHSQEMAFIIEPEARFDLRSIAVNPNADVPVMGVPFPQADRFETALAMFTIVVREQEISKEQLLEDFDVDPRQIDYYSNVLRWMGLVVTDRGVILLTQAGREIANLPHAEKIRRMAEIIFREPIFHHALHHGVENVPHELFARWHCNSATTRNRRLQTVRAWIQFFEEITNQRDLLR